MTSNEKGADQRTVNLPRMLTVELTYPSKSEMHILDGDRGEKIYDKTNHVLVQGPGLMAMKLQRMRLYNPAGCRPYYTRSLSDCLTQLTDYRRAALCAARSCFGPS